MARDIIHEAIREAIERAGWNVTNDPLTIDLTEDDTYFDIDLGAERETSEGVTQKVLAIEIKSFIRSSVINAFHEALGQYLNYQAAIHEQGLDYELFMAISEEGWERLSSFKFIQRRIKQFKLQFILVNIQKKEITKWIR
ncbi:MAG: fatty-acid oxidation protein subunit alpha [Bacteroidetes bacterium]|nr:fatty-acid oxidation protein subunit alpha [Bacteroidota bacterium]MCB0853729.1 fatty-acid oxidation protein subunit alpha [Bacteroidota bacterium]